MTASSASAAAASLPPARLLETMLVEKVWGRAVLPAPFAAPEGGPVGEIWFKPVAACEELLVKFLFTSQKLSVQVHPSTANALAGEAGKEECWLVVDAEPGAQLAIGFKREFATEDIAAAARDGSIEDLLEWHDAAAGDVFYLPAGTVHAIGPGLSLVEVQQNSDTTFRLYDYGRPRELHLERAIAVADCGPYSPAHRTKVTEVGEQCLVNAPHFRLDRVVGAPSSAMRAAYESGALALPLKGDISVKPSDGAAAAAAVTAGPGQCVFAANLDLMDFAEAQITLLAWTG